MKLHYFLLPLCFTCVVGAQTAGTNLRAPAVAGSFYPADPASLRLAVEKFLEDAKTVEVQRPIALIAPHAGYIYSGQICADAYRQARDHDYDLVVILGTNHTDGSFRDISVYPGGAYRTPLGDAQVDREAAADLLARNKHCKPDLKVHEREHSIEVQVPFVQVVFPKAKILPVVIGSPDPQICAGFGKTLAEVIENRNALIVASSDLSHYPAYDDAVETDRKTLAAIAKLDANEVRWQIQTSMSRKIHNLHTCACGEGPILAAIEAAKKLGATRGVVVSYANSGDTRVGGKSEVVGYGSVVLTSGAQAKSEKVSDQLLESSSDSALSSAEKRTLLDLARASLQRFMTTQTIPLARDVPARLTRMQGVFVTLKKHGHLRGCIGHMAADQMLAQTVAEMTVHAAVKDPRFKPVALKELKDIEIEISVLTPWKPIARAEDIVVGRDGVVFYQDGKSAVFLPQVATENGWEYPEMLDNLCLKAGLPRESWKKEGARFFVFQADVFSEAEIRK